MKIVAVFHGNKVTGLAREGFSTEIVANTPVSPKGMDHIFSIVERIRAYAPTALYCSRLARAAGSVSVLAIELDLDFRSMKALGQHGSKDGDDVFMYPGFDNERYADWQAGGVKALMEIAKNHAPDDVVVVVTHKPVIGGLIAHTRGINDEDGVKAVVKEVAQNAALLEKGFVTFDVDHQRIGMAA